MVPLRQTRNSKLPHLLLLVVLLLPLPHVMTGAFAQGPPPVDRAPQPEEAEQARMRRDMEKRANQQRHADLKRDTDSLLKLATELKQYVDKSNENLLSMDVVRKAEEIEKLAHSVREKMKGD